MPMAKIQPQSRTCPRCGNVFLVGGRGRKPYRAIFCSRTCYGTGPATHRIIRELSPTEAAYAAGLLDGEGTVMVWQRKDRPGGRLSVRVVIVNTHRGVIDWLFESVGGNINAKPASRATNYTSTPLPCWSWVANGPNAVNLLRQLLPYLIIKRERAERAIASQPI